MLIYIVILETRIGVKLLQLMGWDSLPSIKSPLSMLKKYKFFNSLISLGKTSRELIVTDR